ncbi:MAG: sirohydrochlorin chelatase [Acidimicrobiaceae bacterium]|nr:sirohydrochlorin chelatase [Acidimicrobiaceae bacterium]
MTANRESAMMVVGHGTTSQEGVSQFERLIEIVRQRVDIRVGHGFIEFAKPDIATGISKLLASNDISNVIVLPLLLLAAGHVKNDLPSAIAAARMEFPRVTFSYARDLSITPELMEIVEQRAHDPFEVIPDAVPHNDHPSFTLCVGRGSNDPDANSDLFKIARLLSERGKLGEVVPAFISLAKPGVPDALERLKRLGARDITVAPYFLFTGSLLERIYSQCRSWSANNPGISLRLAMEMGPDPSIAELLIQRAEETGQIAHFQNCDTCIYRSGPTRHQHTFALPKAP